MQVQAVVGGVQYDVTTDNLVLVAHDGLGEPPIRRLVERGAQQHGDTDVGYRFDPRVFVLAFAFIGDASDRYDERTRLRRLFAAQAELTLLFYVPNGDVRSIECRQIEAPLPVDGAGAFGQRMTYRFRAADPTLYDPAQNTISAWLISVGNELVLPYDLPYFFDQSIVNSTQAITYTGDVDSYPIITLTGPLANATITNETTGESLTLEYVIPTGQAVVIDCRYGHKSVTLTGGMALVLTDESDLGTFHIAAPIDGSGSRTNTMRITGNGAAAAQTSVVMSWYERYGGI